MIVKPHKRRFAAAAMCTLGLGCSWSVLSVLDSSVSPDKDVIAYDLYMGAGGAAGVTERWIIISDENMNLRPRRLPSKYRRAAQFGHGCINMNWTDANNLDLQQCTSRAVTDGTEQIKFKDQKYNITVKTALNCVPEKVYEKIKRVGEKIYCDSLTYAN